MTGGGVASIAGRLAGRRGRSAPPLWAIPALATVALVLLPLIYLVLRAAQNGWRAYLGAIWTPLVGALVLRTVALAAGVVALAVLLALAVAWLVARTDLPGRRLWAVLGALPLVLPSYVAALVLVTALGPRGHLQQLLEPLGVERLPALAYGYPGALLALALFTFPYVYLPVLAALRDLDPALEESARALGAGPWRSFFTVVLPQLKPALYGGGLIVALYVFSDFGAVSITRYNTFTLAIYNAYRGLFDRTTAAALATVLVLLTVVLIAAEGRLAAGLRPSRQRPSRPAPRLALGAWRWPALVLVGGLALVTLGLPLAVLGFWGVRGLLRGDAVAGLLAAAGNSLVAALVAALAAVVLSLPIAIWSVRYRSRLAVFVERLSYAGFALPGLVIALALVFFAARRLPALYQTLPLLVLAYVIRFLPEALSATRGALAQVTPAFEEAARGLGRRPLAVLRTVTVPLVLPGMVAGGSLVFLTAMKELPATLLLRPIGFETLATEIWSYASEAIYGQAALPALVLLAVTAPPLYLLTIRPVLAGRNGG
ncbi:MAG: iron ABC transporter permease [Acidobacteria bacterium]|nr:MAG: iron ABC transporter permease [Acidobacteriota bacterium]